MTQGVVSMSARQVAPRKTSTKSFLIVSAASAANLLPTSAAQNGNVMVSPEVAEQVDAFVAAKQGNVKGSQVAFTTLVGGSRGALSRSEKSKVSKARQFLRQYRSREEREKLRTVAFLNTRLPHVLQKFNAQIDMLTTGDAFRKAYLVDKTRANKIHTALGEARAQIVKQEQPLLTKMSTFNWISHAEVWDKELQDINRRIEQATDAIKGATQYVFGQPNVFNAVVTPLTTSDDAWKRSVTVFNTTLDAYAKRNIQLGDKLISTMSAAEKKKFRVVSKRRFEKMCNNIFRDFKTGKLRKGPFMKWIRAQLANKSKAESEMDQLVASMGIVNSYFKALDPNNVHVINAMAKAQVNEEVYKSVLHTIAKEMETTLRAEGMTLQNLVKNSITPALASTSNYSKLVGAIDTAYLAGVGMPEAKFENSLEAMVLTPAATFYKNMGLKKFNIKTASSRLDNEEGQLEPQPLANPENFNSFVVGAAIMHDRQLSRADAGESAVGTAASTANDSTGF